MPSGTSICSSTSRVTRATVSGRLPPFVSQSGERILMISVIPVKEMLGIINEMGYAGSQIAHGVFYDIKVLFGTQTQCIGNVQQPGFTEDRNDWSLRLKQSLNARVTVAGKRMSSRGPECRDACVGQFQLMGTLEERHIARIRA